MPWLALLACFPSAREQRLAPAFDLELVDAEGGVALLDVALETVPAPPVVKCTDASGRVHLDPPTRQVGFLYDAALETWKLTFRRGDRRYQVVDQGYEGGPAHLVGRCELTDEGPIDVILPLRAEGGVHEGRTEGLGCRLEAVQPR